MVASPPPPKARRGTNADGAREAALRAACELAKRSGVLGMSVDKVIEQAGISKGGFFHHFPTKEALVIAVVESELDRFASVVDFQMAAGQRFSQAIVEALCEFLQSNATMMASVNVALASGEAVRSIVTARRAAWLQELENELGAGPRAKLLALAIDGVIFSCSMQAQPYTPAELRAIKRALLAAAEA